jgi:hypothetical protein
VPQSAPVASFSVPQKFLRSVGPLASPLKRFLVLPVVILAAAVLAVLSTGVVVATGVQSPAWAPWLVAFGIAAAVAVFVDKIADAYDGLQSDLEFAGSESAAEASVSSLNAFLAEAIEVSFLDGDVRENAMISLRRHLVTFACKSIGPGTRASYYTLDPHEAGIRVLGQVEHAVEGRRDKPDRPFEELKSPKHDVWSILSGADERPDVQNNPDRVRDLNWDEKPYDCFVSIPVKARGVQFGLLSVNNATKQSIGEAQRAVLISMARAMAMAYAFDLGSVGLNGRARNA